MPSATGPKDVVKLSAGEAALTKKEADDVKDLQAKISALQEESTARQKSVIEAQEKTAYLEKQIANMQQLLALKNSTMTDLQKQAEIQAAINKNAAISQVPSVIEQPQPAEATPTNVEKPAPPIAAAIPPASPKPPPVVVAEPVAEVSFLNGADLPLVVSAAGLIALLGGWMFLRNKRRRNLADFEQGIMTSGGLRANTVFGNTSGSSVDTGDTSFLTDFSQSANGGMIDTNDVDPIAEAEVYMAYGRDAQAEEILRDAIAKEPKRFELHLKLIEMYAASKNVSAFEDLAGELYTTLGADDPTWVKVADIGRSLEPSNPLYQAKTAHSASHAPNEKLEINQKLESNDFSSSSIASEKDIDFTFDNDSLVKNFASTPSDKDAFDLELDSIANQSTDEIELTGSAPSTESLTADTMQSLAIAETNDALDFDFGDLTSSLDKTTEADDSNFVSTKIEPELAIDISANAEISESFDMPKLNESARVEPILTDLNDTRFVKIEAITEESNFDFDLSSLSPEAASYVDNNSQIANTYDLSGISLDMTDTDATQPAKTFAEVDSMEDEPIEIEIKLDLVAAYIEMDDAEGAKELLDEVMKEGGTTQRKRAEALLAKMV
jgi:pilus assembly protein FimV